MLDQNSKIYTVDIKENKLNIKISNYSDAEYLSRHQRRQIGLKINMKAENI